MFAKFCSVNTLIIDEISMVSDKLLTYISRRLSSIKCNNIPFGGMNIITVGDFFQLRPIKGKLIFHNSLWRLFHPVFLDQNMSQKKDSTYANLLNRARVGALSPEDIDLLKAKIPSVLHIFAKIANVNQHNQLCQSMLSDSMLTIHAVHFFSSNNPSAGQNTGG